ncbi:MAG: CRISPR-associated helicase Cas3', partial [Promethearchaeota archaeon]
SLLCDLDVWDARFFINSKPTCHDLPFFESFNILPLQNYLNEKFLVENYVSKPFGCVSKNYTKFEPDLEQKKLPEIILNLRIKLFLETNQNIEKRNIKQRIFWINSPTGAGKTLTLLNCAQKIIEDYQKKANSIIKIIYALPFVSIGTQVAEQINKLIFNEKDLLEAINSNIMTIDNYLTDNFWSISKDGEHEILYGKDAKWLISSWRSRYIVTTFVKLFHSILKPFKFEFLKFHRIAHSIILLDEVQCVPIQYWTIIEKTLKILASIFQCTIFLSTATRPLILNEINNLSDKHLLNKIKEDQTIDEALNRYTIYFYPSIIILEDFFKKIKEYLQKNISEDVLIVLNTRKSVFCLYEYLVKYKNNLNAEIDMLSTLILPLDRKNKIEYIKNYLKIRNNNPSMKRIIVISTQLIEAGVDFSFKVVFRDFAPLDSIVQVAGRCNRNFEHKNGTVHVVILKKNTKSKGTYFNKIYDIPNGMKIIKKFLKYSSKSPENPQFDYLFGKYYIIDEKDLRKNFEIYFNEISKNKLTNQLVNEMLNLKFKRLAEEFSLIDDKYIAPLLILSNNDTKKLFESIKKTNTLNNLFYLYSITIPINKAKNLVEMGILKVFKLNSKILFYYLPEDKVEQYYNSKTGFNIF